MHWQGPTMTHVRLEDAHDEQIYGGKAAGLSEALLQRLPVPHGFALSVTAVDSIVEGQAAEITCLESAFNDLGGAVAVRSSAVGEDSASASFAGQHLTCLNVRSVPELVETVRQVWESGRSTSTLAYRATLGLNAEVRIAVVLQKQVDPDCAGVLFTRNPVDGTEELVVEASWGLGEVVVAGLVVPDRYRISLDGVIRERTPGMKDVIVRLDSQGGTETIDAEPEQIDSLCLSDDQLTQLHELASKCEDAAREPRDLEWAFSGNELVLLQSRAITA